jgi:hypothetical protein
MSRRIENLDDVWTLTLAPMPGDGPPMARRVARILKFALRSARVKCLRHCGPCKGELRSIEANQDEVLPLADTD